MNERIEKLMPKPWVFPYPDREMYSKEQFEKFAELIVKACVEDCRDMFMVGSVSWNLLNEKLDHFGVEE